MAFGQIVEFDKFHSEAHIRLIRTIAAHGIVVGHAWKFAEINIQDALKQMAGQALKRLQYIFAGHKGHFAVYLCKLRLAVSTKVLISEALDDLEIAIHARDHQDLLKGLRGLW